MFTTHPPFKHPVQWGDGTQQWNAVELTLSTPWYVATMVDEEEDLTRTFLLTGSDELTAFATSDSLGRLSSLRLVLPPNWSVDGDWHFVVIKRVDLQLRPADGAGSEAIVQAINGTRYGGFPIQPLTGRLGALVPLAELNEPTRSSD